LARALADAPMLWPAQWRRLGMSGGVAMGRRHSIAASFLKVARDHDLAQRVEVMEAAVFRLTVELDRLRGSTSKAPPPSSMRSQRIVLEAITRRIEADGGSTKVTASGIVAKVGLHQTYVAAILKTLETEGLQIVSGKRARIYRLPSAANG
jgi:hypothetical protein